MGMADLGEVAGCRLKPDHGSGPRALADTTPMRRSHPDSWRPRRVTPTLPGPRSHQVLQHAAQVLNHGTVAHLLPFVQAGKSHGLLTDLDGNEYVDCLSAWGSEPYGSAHPQVAAAMGQAWQQHGAQISLAVLSEPVIHLAQRLVAMAQRRSPGRSSPSPAPKPWNPRCG